jgi:hypothetical protein
MTCGYLVAWCPSKMRPGSFDSSANPDWAGGLARLGVYGLCLPDLKGASNLLIPGPASWIDWHIHRRLGEDRPEEHLDDQRARVWSQPAGWVDVDRRGQSATLHLPSLPTDGEIVHPYLASTASIVARWRGLHSFHAGAFVMHGRAWAILGPKGAGKSSLLASMALAGIPILTDDVLVIRDDHGLAGPRCIDLRHESAMSLGVGEALGVVGLRERWRLHPGLVEPEVRIAGWICLEWGERRFATVPAGDRPAVLLGSLALRVQPADPTSLMELLTLPMFALRHPRDIDHLAITSAFLIDQLERASC